MSDNSEILKFFKSFQKIIKLEGIKFGFCKYNYFITSI
jgi:hypothetical protein